MAHCFEVKSHLRNREKEEYPVSPFLVIKISQADIDADGDTVLTAHLMTETEIDHAIDRLREDLEVVRKAAKKELKSLHQK
jgi:hypothetical protein